MNRRKLLKFLGVGGLAINSSLFLSACSSFIKKSIKSKGIEPSDADEVILAEGLNYYKLIMWKDSLSDKKEILFGFNNDYIALLKGDKNETLMWVNHESVNPLYVSGYAEKHAKNKTKKQINIEKKNVGGSCFQIENIDGKWLVNKKYEKNYRLDANSKIKFSPPQKISGSDHAIGTFANCAGGVTPWNTVLTCEENIDNFVGDVKLTTNGVKKISRIDNKMSWEALEKLPAQHYGWVVEYDPRLMSAKKLISLGRFAHECATCVESIDKKTVVYMADDKNNEHLYKFIANSPGQLDKGTLYVANMSEGKWMPLDYNLGEPFKSKFRNQQELLIFARDAAKLVGATPLDRPEDVAIHPKTGEVYIALTNNKSKGNYHGSILKLSEKNNNPLSLQFKSEEFLVGGESFSCPDNLVFDYSGNLWMTSDISGGSIGKSPYNSFANNGLFCISTSGNNAGDVIQVASAPKEAEFTGPCFSKDFKTLFLSVQHPGEKTKDINKPHSSWPHDTGSKQPHPAVICIQGPLLNELQS